MATLSDYVDIGGECFNVTPLIYQTTVGTSHTLTTISGGKTLTFSAAHNLFIGDTLIWTSSFNNIEANALYYILIDTTLVIATLATILPIIPIAMFAMAARTVTVMPWLITVSRRLHITNL